MRDPNRIPKILSILQQCWEKVPNLRFGQLIENLKKYMGVEDLFYIEDEELLEKLTDFLKQANIKN